MKKFFFMLCVLILCMVMVVPAAMAKAIKIRFSHVVSVNTPKGWAANEFARRVNKALEGKYEVLVFPSAQLYGDNQAIEALSAGFIEMAAPSSAKFRHFNFLICRFSFRKLQRSIRLLTDLSVMKFEKCS